MFPLITLEEMERNEHSINEKRLVCILLVQPHDSGSQEIINRFNSMHYQTGRYCSVYTPGYAEFFPQKEYPDARHIGSIAGHDWYYSDKAFWKTVNDVQARIKSWQHNGEAELILLQSQCDAERAMDFQNYGSFQIQHGIRKGYIESFPILFTNIVKAAEREVSVVDVTHEVRRKRLSIMRIAEIALDACKLVPESAKDLLKEQLFYATATHKAVDDED